jgi:cytochrome c biogenesis factor
MSLEKMEEREYGNYFRLGLFGFIVWLVPFLVSFLFYTPAGTPIVGVAFFNSIMSVVLCAVVVLMVFHYLKPVTQDFVKEAFNVGIAWLAISVILDVIVLLPMSKMTVYTYVTDVALGYLVIPLVALFAGYLLEEKSHHTKKIFSQIASTKK